MRTLLMTFLVQFLFGSMAYAVKVDADSAWVRQPRGKLKMTGAFISITNPSKSDDELISASCDCAEVTEIHLSSHQDGMMKMERVAGINIKAGETVALKPGSYHIMLMKLKKPLKAGDTVSLQLKFKHAGAVTVDAKVKAQ